MDGGLQSGLCSTTLLNHPETDDRQELGIVIQSICKDCDFPTTGTDGVDGTVLSGEFDDLFL